MIEKTKSRFIQRKPLVVSTPKIGLDVQRFSSLSHNTSFQHSARGISDIPAPYTHPLESESSVLLSNSGGGGDQDSNSSFRLTRRPLFY